MTSILIESIIALWREEHAASTAEYALVLAILAGGAIVAIAAIDRSISAIFKSIGGLIGQQVRILWPDSPL